MEPETRPERAKRAAVPLTARDLADLALIRNSPEAQRAVGLDESAANASEASLLHELLTRVFERAREAAQEAGYAAYAEWAATDPEEVLIRHAERARRDRRLAREAAE